MPKTNLGLINCPFCGKRGVTRNRQGFPVCDEHRNELINNLKCVCGRYLDIKKSKYALIFSCINCGIINLDRVVEVNKDILKKQCKSEEVVIRSDDENSFYFT